MLVILEKNDTVSCLTGFIGVSKDITSATGDRACVALHSFTKRWRLARIIPNKNLKEAYVFDKTLDNLVVCQLHLHTVAQIDKLDIQIGPFWCRGGGLSAFGVRSCVFVENRAHIFHKHFGADCDLLVLKESCHSGNHVFKIQFDEIGIVGEANQGFERMNVFFEVARLKRHTKQDVVLAIQIVVIGAERKENKVDFV